MTTERSKYVLASLSVESENRITQNQFHSAPIIFVKPALSFVSNIVVDKEVVLKSVYFTDKALDFCENP